MDKIDETELKRLEADIALMRAAGHKTLPIRFEVIEKVIAELRRRQR